MRAAGRDPVIPGLGAPLRPLTVLPRPGRGVSLGGPAWAVTPVGKGQGMLLPGQQRSAVAGRPPPRAGGCPAARVAPVALESPGGRRRRAARRPRSPPRPQRPEGEQPVLLRRRAALPCPAGRGTRERGSNAPAKPRSFTSELCRGVGCQHAVAPREWGMVGWLLSAVVLVNAVLRRLADLLVDENTV